ncbi:MULTISPECIES: hypothetical protein [unclassified Caballeronia]|uniref:hypothetical protein n=1 Tax=unclassified Caballeronia TaxID=2646786 RepID=UPI00202927BD|nr:MULTISPECIES: hypothetical protein [unclassified Caballeronia]
MTAEEILELIRLDAENFFLHPAQALPAYSEIVAELSDRLNIDDLTTLVAIGSVIYRDAQAQAEAEQICTRLCATLSLRNRFKSSGV